MFSTPSQIISSAVLGLGTPEANLLQDAEVENIFFRKLALYYEGARQSDQNVLSTWTDEFTLGASENSKDLTSLTSSAIVLPLWAERKIIDGTNTMWEFVPTVNLDTLAESRSRFRMAVAFDGSTTITATFSAYGSELIHPESTFRVRYSPVNPINGNKDASLSIPETLAPLLIVDTQLSLIDLLCVNAAKYMDKQPHLAMRCSAWQGMKEGLQSEKLEWFKMYEAWRKKSRAYHRAIDHNSVLGDIGL